MVQPNYLILPLMFVFLNFFERMFLNLTMSALACALRSVFYIYRNDRRDEAERVVEVYGCGISPGNILPSCSTAV